MDNDFIPMDVEECYENVTDCVSLMGTMSKDFGPWKKGDTELLTFDFEKGTVSDTHLPPQIVKIELKIKE